VVGEGKKKKNESRGVGPKKLYHLGGLRFITFRKTPGQKKLMGKSRRGTEGSSRKWRARPVTAKVEKVEEKDIQGWEASVLKSPGGSGIAQLEKKRNQKRGQKGLISPLEGLRIKKAC